MELMARLMPREPSYAEPVGISGNYMDPDNQKKIAEAIRFVYRKFLQKDFLI